MRPTLPTVVVAPDKLKGSLTAAEAATALAAGIRNAAPGLQVLELPIADGGDGTVAAALAAGWRRVDVVAEDAAGTLHDTFYAAKGSSAIVELAQVCGLVGLGGRLDPLGSGTEGLGAVIAHAIDRGAREIVIGLGGSASTDGGAGMLRRLGARTVGAVRSGGAGLVDVTGLDLADVCRDVSFVLAADVDNPLFGPRGAAAVFGPQKGADPEQVVELEASLRHWASIVEAEVGTGFAELPGAGAAGGAGFAAIAVLGAKRLSGADVVLDLVGFDAAVRGATLVITGEGALDEQTLEGKGPAAVARRAGDVPVVAVAGRNLLSTEQLRAAGFSAAYSLADLESNPDKSMTNAAALLRQIGAQIARNWLNSES